MNFKEYVENVLNEGVKENLKEEIDRLVAQRDMIKDELSNERNENKKQQLRNHIKEIENEIKQFRIKLSKIN